MKKLVSGALGDVVDESKRKFIKQTGALGAIAATPKVAREMAAEVPAQKVFKSFPKDIYDVPYFKGMVRDMYEEGALGGVVDSDLDFIQQYSDELQEWLDGDLQTGDLNPRIAGLIDTLHEDYGMDQQQVFNFFKDQGVELE